MKFILILSCLALYVALSQAQAGCRGGIREENQECRGPKNEGHALFFYCRRQANDNMWWYDRSSRTCKTMSYLGCGGNTNRYCTRSACQRKCGRST